MNDVQTLVSRLGGHLEYREFSNWKNPLPGAPPLAAVRPAPANQSQGPAKRSLLAAYAGARRPDPGDSPARQIPLAEVFSLLERGAA
jgi:hypothetical protein